MQPSTKSINAALSTTGLTAVAVGALLIAHPHAAATPEPDVASPAYSDMAFVHTEAAAMQTYHRADERRHARSGRRHRRARHRVRRVEQRQHHRQHRRAHTADLPSSDPQAIAQSMLGSYGWSDGAQWGCLDELWDRESGWDVSAANPSGAYGIPQALPGDKMASAGPDWESDATTQIRWGLGYIRAVYGSPCAALDHSDDYGYY